MKTIVYSCPFVPPEWIAGHGLRPCRVVPAQSGGMADILGLGVCPYARAYLNAVCSGDDATDAVAAVFTTTCDQMRRAAELAEPYVPTFLMHVPTTWQTPQTHRFYGDELKRLGRFLEELGGSGPTASALAEVMLDYDTKRQRVLDARPFMSARAFSEAAMNVHESHSEEETREDGLAAKSGGKERGEDAASTIRGSGVLAASSRRNSRSNAIALDGVSPSTVRLALVGGPIPREDYVLLDHIEAAGGAVVLDATENGERTLPAPFDRRRVREDPFGQLVDAYFGHIPDAFRRPNSALYTWLKREFAARDVHGIVLRRYVWCDTWHAEVQRMAEWAPVPLLALDVEDGFAVNARTRSRIDAFIEALR